MDYKVLSDPEFIGKMLIRQELTVLPADDPNRKPLNWTCHFITDEEHDEINSKRNLKRLKKIREAVPNMQDFDPKRESYCYTVIPVLEFLNGRPWNNMALNIIESVRPTAIEVVKPNGAVTLDCYSWRVRVYLDEKQLIERIEQEVQCGCVGFRNGQDISNYIKGNDSMLTTPQGTCFFNPRGISKMELNTDCDDDDK